jgi:hypothetical protein
MSCGKKFVHPGHGEAFLIKDPDLETRQPLKGKEFACELVEGHPGNHAAVLSPASGNNPAQVVSWE